MSESCCFCFVLFFVLVVFKKCTTCLFVLLLLLCFGSMTNRGGVNKKRVELKYKAMYLKKKPPSFLRALKTKVNGKKSSLKKIGSFVCAIKAGKTKR